MFCKKCGKKINDNAKFCCYCGQQLNQPICPVPAVKKQEKLSFDNIKKVIIAVLIVCVVVPVIMLIVNQSNSNRIDPYENLTVYFEGENGCGVIRYEYPQDYDPFNALKDEMAQLEEKYYDYLYNGTLSDWTKMNEIANKIQKIDNLYDSIKMKISRQTELSNNEKITITFSWDDEIAKELGYKLKSEKTYTVSGLEEIES